MSLLKLISTTAILIVGFTTFSQDALWANAFGSTTYEYAAKTRIDSDNNQIIAGSFEETIELGMAGPSSTLTSAGGADGYIAKYDDEANLDWAISIEGPGQLQLLDCAIDNDNNIYVVGGFTGTLDFDPSAGVENRTTFELSSQEIFIAKYDSDGDLLWVNTYESGDYGDRATDIAIDSDGNCYVIGLFFGTIDMDPDGPDGNISSPFDDVYATFLVTLTPSGSFIDANKYWYTFPADVEVDTDGNIYVAGRSFDTVDFDLAFGVSEYVSPLGFQFGFVAKNTNDFGFEWVYIVDDASGTFHGVQEIAVSAAGDIYVSGFFEGTVDFDPSAGTAELTELGDWRDPFSVKLKSDMSFEWVHSTTFSSEMYIDGDDNLYSAGNFTGEVDFDPGVGVEIYTATEGGGEEGPAGSGFIQKMNSDGDLLWVEIMEPGAAGASSIHSISGDSDESIYAIGVFADSVYINTSPESEFAAVGGSDSFIVKFGAACDIDNSVSATGITLTVGEVGAVYQWLDCDDAYAEILGETSQSFTATDNGNYACQVTVDLCVDTSACEAITSVGLADEAQFDFNVYPNPTTGIVFLTTTEFVQTTIFNASGELMMTTTENQIDLSAFSSGLYILKAATDKGVVIRKIQLR